MSNNCRSITYQYVDLLMMFPFTKYGETWTYLEEFANANIREFSMLGSNAPWRSVRFLIWSEIHNAFHFNVEYKTRLCIYLNFLIKSLRLENQLSKWTSLTLFIYFWRAVSNKCDFKVMLNNFCASQGKYVCTNSKILLDKFEYFVIVCEVVDCWLISLLP